MGLVPWAPASPSVHLNGIIMTPNYWRKEMLVFKRNPDNTAVSVQTENMASLADCATGAAKTWQKKSAFFSCCSLPKNSTAGHPRMWSAVLGQDILA